jgi:pyruvate dehydrogenase E2 component (dihydrolipoamide acetyltransferase)
MDLKLPDLGEGVMEGEVVKWLVKPGDQVTEDQVVLEIMTDKATVEIPTKFTGKVQSLEFKEGDIAKVGAVMMRLEGSAGASAAKAAPAPAAKAAAPAAAPAPAAKAAPAPAAPAKAAIVNNDPQAAPAVRKLAREKGIELGTVRGSGPHGRILLSDVENFQPGMGGGAGFANRGQRGQRNEERVPVRGLRKKISEKMTQSMRTVANYAYVEEIDLTDLTQFRQALKPKAEKMGVKVSYLPFIFKACQIALKEFPTMNAASVEGEHGLAEIIYKKYYNLGLAVDTEDGLTVAVVKDVDCKGIWEIASDINTLGAKARDKKLTMDDLKEGTFTISNAGTIGGLFAPPIINYPEVAIMGVHQIKKRPMVIGDEIKIRDMIYLSLSLDHRVVDGAVAARFMNRVKGLLENPNMLMLEMLGDAF